MRALAVCLALCLVGLAVASCGDDDEAAPEDALSVDNVMERIEDANVVDSYRSRSVEISRTHIPGVDATPTAGFEGTYTVEIVAVGGNYHSRADIDSAMVNEGCRGAVETECLENLLRACEEHARCVPDSLLGQNLFYNGIRYRRDGDGTWIDANAYCGGIGCSSTAELITLTRSCDAATSAAPPGSIIPLSVLEDVQLLDDAAAGELHLRGSFPNPYVHRACPGDTPRPSLVTPSGVPTFALTGGLDATIDVWVDAASYRLLRLREDAALISNDTVLYEQHDLITYSDLNEAELPMPLPE